MTQSTAASTAAASHCAGAEEKCTTSLPSTATPHSQHYLHFIHYLHYLYYLHYRVLTVERGGHGDPLPGVHAAVQQHGGRVPAQLAPPHPHPEDAPPLVSLPQLQQRHELVTPRYIL